MKKFNAQQRNNLIEVCRNFLDAPDAETKNEWRIKLIKVVGDVANLQDLAERIVYEARARNQGGLNW